MNHLAGIFILGVSGSLHPNSSYSCPRPCHVKRNTEPRGANLTHSVPLCLSQGSKVPGSTFADGELLPREPGFFPEDEDEAMTLAPPEGPPESDMDSPMESTQSLEGSVGSPAEEKDGGLRGLFLPEDK